MRFYKIIPESYVDGPGKRAVVYLQGCSLAYPDCQSQHLWDPNGGNLTSAGAVAETLMEIAPHGNITISGGEPFVFPTRVGWTHRRSPCGARGLNLATGHWPQTTLTA